MADARTWSQPSEGSSVLVLSPHLDDAVWSIGSLLAVLADAKCHVMLATAFSDMGGNVSSVGLDLASRAGLEGPEAARIRRAEDHDAAQVLRVDTRHLGLVDAVSRLPDEYTTRERLAGPRARVLRADPAVEQYGSVLAVLADEFSPALILAPLGIGGHVDHQIVAGVACQMSNVNVWYYEDFPYCAITPFVPSALTNGPASRRQAAFSIVPVASGIDRHLVAACRYGSQVRSFFGGPDALSAKLSAWLLDVGGDVPAVRLWSISETASVELPRPSLWVTHTI